jgi:hypothetical protein
VAVNVSVCQIKTLGSELSICRRNVLPTPAEPRHFLRNDIGV